jgi:hypothetical protein
MKAEYLLKVLVLWIVLIFPVRAHSVDLGTLRLNQIEGDVQVQSTGMKEWLPAVMNLPLQVGDRLWVPKGAWAQVETREGSVIRLDAESALEILEAGKDSLQLYLSQGQAYVNFQSGQDIMLQMDTPLSSLRVYDSSTFNVALVENGNTEVSVFRGAVFAENRSGEVRVSGGNMLSLDEGVPSLMALGSPSDWEQWNRGWDDSLRDEEDSEQYLPPELTVYGRDLNRNGRWVTTSEYGYVWTPTTHISTDWAPYREGRWVWIGDDYVWIASEPWGWAPYHYGRWSYISAHGWCWVPPPRNEVYWGPGYVSWVATSDNVAWVPLAPAEIYYGRGNYGPHSVNIVNVSVNNYAVVPGRNYRNVQVHGAVTVLHRDVFLGGRHNREHNRRDDMSNRENPFLRENISIGRPRIDPQHATKMPILKDIPKEHEPPAHIRSFPGRSVGGARDMIRERDRSVFTPTAKPQPLTPTVRMNTEREVKQEGGRTLPGAGGRQEILEHSVKPGQFRGRPTINRDNGQEVEPFSDGKKEIRKPVVPPIPVQEQPALENKEGAAPSFRGRPRLPERMVRPGQSQDRPTLDQDALKSAPPAIERPEVVRPPAPEQPDANDNDKTPPSFRGRPQMPDRGQFRGRPAIEQDAPKPPPSQPAVVRPQMAPPPAPVHEQPDANDKPAPSFRGRPQMPDRTEMPGQFRGRPAIEQDAPKPPPNQPAVERRQVAPPPAPAPQQGQPPQPDPEAVKRLQQQAAEKEKKKQEEADRMREMLEQGKQQKGKRPTFP